MYLVPQEVDNELLRTVRALSRQSTSTTPSPSTPVRSSPSHAPIEKDIITQ